MRKKEAMTAKKRKAREFRFHENHYVYNRRKGDPPSNTAPYCGAESVSELSQCEGGGPADENGVGCLCCGPGHDTPGCGVVVLYERKKP